MYSSHKINKGDVLALQFAMHACPVRLLDAPMAPLAAPVGVKRRLRVSSVHGRSAAARRSPALFAALQSLSHR